MPGDRSQQISIRIDQKISRLSKTSNRQCIFRVHDQLRSLNELAYEPQVVSIGPYHQGKSKFKEMERLKLRYLQELLLRTHESSAEKYILSLTELEEQALQCYAEDNYMGLISSGDDFVEMMCLDGCFIIELFRKYHYASNPGGPKKDDPNIALPKNGDPIFRKDWLLASIMRDLILFENQLPFFILIKLFDMSKLRGEEEINLIGLAIFFLNQLFPGETSSSTNFADAQVIHLLDIMHKSSCSSFAEAVTNDDEKVYTEVENFELEHIKSASELRQTGIKFEKATESKSWLDITFENGVIKIPHLRIHEFTECVLRNLIAYEQYILNPEVDRRCVLDYAKFMDFLIDSSMDVEMLRHRQIISNWLGEDQDISSMFNNLSKEVAIDEEMFCYSRVCKQVNKYSSRRQNIWRAHLLRNYFNNPWSIISFLAAIVLLLLTFVQTILSILDYCKK